MATGINEVESKRAYKIYKVFSDYTLNGHGYYWNIYNCEPVPGYEMVGIAGFYFTGNNSAHLNLQSLWFTSSENQLNIGVQNTINSSITFNLFVVVMYESNPNWLS